jgi:hypothetical protein
MEGQASAGRVGRSRASVWIAALLVGAALGLGAFFVVRALTGNEDEDRTLKGPPGSAFTLTYPKGWTPLSGKELVALPGSPTAVVRRTDRSGILIVNRQSHVSSNFDKLSRQLDRRLKRSIPDFKKVSSHGVGIKAGQAFLYSYIRKRKGTVHSVVVVPMRSGGFSLDAVVRANARDTARQVGAMIRSFDVK